MSGQEKSSELPEWITRMPGRQSSPIRLIIIPLLIFIVWSVETYLLEGSLGVFSVYQPDLFFIYMLIANILVGTVAPIICLKSAFMSGAVNMYQVGFRSLRRTTFTVGITACAGYLVLMAASPYGSGRIPFISTALLMLPLAIGSVMICWVLIGTHMQAYVRRFGAAVSICLGVLMTGVLFGLSFIVHSPPHNDLPHILTTVGIGIAIAIFFFSIRDIYSTVVLVDLCLVFFVRGNLDSAYTSTVSLSAIAGALLSLATLLGCQWYLSRRFVTIRVPAIPGKGGT
jgi:hypothetical protein